MPILSSIRPVLSLQYQLVTDRRTHDDSKYRASMASSGNNFVFFVITSLYAIAYIQVV